jgi:hypothetical protein
VSIVNGRGMALDTTTRLESLFVDRNIKVVKVKKTSK